MKKLSMLAVVMVLSIAAVNAQSKEKTSNTKQVAQKKTEVNRSEAVNLSEDKIEAIKQRASKATKVSKMQSQQQLDAQRTERRKNAQPVQKGVSSDQ